MDNIDLYTYVLSDKTGESPKLSKSKYFIVIADCNSFILLLPDNCFAQSKSRLNIGATHTWNASCDSVHIRTSV